MWVIVYRVKKELTIWTTVLGILVCAKIAQQVDTREQKVDPFCAMSALWENIPNSPKQPVSAPIAQQVGRNLLQFKVCVRCACLDSQKSNRVSLRVPSV